MRRGTPEEERARFLALLEGRGEAALNDFVCLNAGAILWLAGRSTSFTDGVTQAKALLASGAAMSRLTLWRACQQQAGRA